MPATTFCVGEFTPLKLSPYASDSTMAAPLPSGSMPALRRSKSGSKPQVVIGEGGPENFAGATMIGKTITDELAYSLNGENFHYGTPKNVNAPGRIPGGSSSGLVG